MKKWIISLLLGIIIAVGGINYKCIDNAKKANVLIETTVVDPFWGTGYVIGSGVIISDNGLVVTAKHVVEDSLSIQIMLSDGEIVQVDTNSVYLDPDTDLAVIDINSVTPYSVKIGTADKYDYIFGIGTANGIIDNSLSLGYIYNESFHRLFFGDNEMLFMTMKIYPGCSGGGVYHWNKLVGIMVASDGGYNSFAVSSTEIEKFLRELKEI
jgi:S1-C subfamily serine protease